VNVFIYPERTHEGDAFRAAEEFFKGKGERVLMVTTTNVMEQLFGCAEGVLTRLNAPDPADRLGVKKPAEA
jgi:hypothetical protein